MKTVLRYTVAFIATFFTCFAVAGSYGANYLQVALPKEQKFLENYQVTEFQVRQFCSIENPARVGAARPIVPSRTPPMPAVIHSDSSLAVIEKTQYCRKDTANPRRLYVYGVILQMKVINMNTGSESWHQFYPTTNKPKKLVDKGGIFIGQHDIEITVKLNDEQIARALANNDEGLTEQSNWEAKLYQE